MSRLCSQNPVLNWLLRPQGIFQKETVYRPQKHTWISGSHFECCFLVNSSFWICCTSGPRRSAFQVALLSIWFPFSSSPTLAPAPPIQLGFSEWLWPEGSWTLKIPSDGREGMQILEARRNSEKMRGRRIGEEVFVAWAGEVNPQLFCVRNMYTDRLVWHCPEC